MAITAKMGNHILYKLLIKAIDLANDTFKIILMDGTFVYDPVAHDKLADLGSPTLELATGNGYTRQNKTLTGGTVTKSDSPAKVYRVFDNVTWTAASGNIGPTGAALIYDDTDADKTIIGCIDFGTDYEIPDGSSFQLQSIQIALELPV